MAEPPGGGRRGKAARLKWTRDPEGRLQRGRAAGNNNAEAPQEESLEDMGGSPNPEE